MKYCTSCGKELNDRAKFCTGCGKAWADTLAEDVQQIPLPKKPLQQEKPPVTEIPNHEEIPPAKEVIQEETPQDVPNFQTEPMPEDNSADNPADKKKSLSKGKIVLYSVLAVSLVTAIVAAVLVLRWYTSTEQQILRALDAGDYDSVVVIMEEDTSANESKALEDQLKERIANIKTGFKDETIEYASAKMELDTIKELNVDGVSSELSAVRTYVDQLNESRTNFSTAEFFYTTGNYAEAITDYRLVIEDDKNYTIAVEKLADAVNKYREEILTKAMEFADAEFYSDAIALLNEALKTIPNDTIITEQIRIYEKDNSEKLKADALETASNYAKDGDYLNAFKSLTSIMKSQANDAELVSAYNKYCDQYAAQIIREVDVKVSEKDFDGAISSLNTALKNLSSNKVLTDKLEEVKEKRPISITSLVTINSGYWDDWNSADAKDTFGNDYSTACNYVKLQGYHLGSANLDHYIEHRLYGDYTSLTGSIVPHSDSKEDRISYLQVYVDDELVYTSADIGRKTDLIDFSIDVTGAEYVKIVVYTEAWASVILYDVQLWP